MKPVEDTAFALWAYNKYLRFQIWNQSVLVAMFQNTDNREYLSLLKMDLTALEMELVRLEVSQSGNLAI